MIKPYLNLRLALGIAIGAIAGYAYYYFVGCNSGTCAITSNPVNSTLYGTAMGVLLFLKKNDDKPMDSENEESSSD